MIHRLCIAVTAFTLGGATWGDAAELPADVYAEKVYASWLGQCIGNMYGLHHENKYTKEPPTDDIPLTYQGWPLEAMKKHDGAFSDDDTDIEYMVLFAMEEGGVEPTYETLARRWKRHIHHHIWVANYSARSLMSRGYLPPDTGKRGLNPNWFQIDPQLVNEVWAVTAPGMVRYAAEKSDWAARITNDDYGTHPTIWYGAMYSAAFLEADVEELFETGLAHTPPGRFRDALVLVKLLHKKFPDWREPRRILRDLYWTHEPQETRSGVAAVINGALGALALLYGEGDFKKTLFLSCMAGFDCDNQAATLAGLLGVAGGLKVLPQELLRPVESWKKPFNDRYVILTRDDLPDSTLTRMAERTVSLGEKILLKHGGKIFDREGRKMYRLPTNARFVPPYEIRMHPVGPLRLGEPASLELSVIGGSGRAQVGSVTSVLPPGLSHANGTISGTPEKAGRFDVRVAVKDLPSSKLTSQAETTLSVLPENLAKQATGILTYSEGASSKSHGTAELLRDGRRFEGSFRRTGGAPEKAAHWYGYQWQQPLRIAHVIATEGDSNWKAGWWKQFTAEYRDGEGHWKPLKNLHVFPDILVAWAWAYRPHTLSFDPVETTAIRVGGEVRGEEGFSSMAELEVYGQAVK